MKTNREHFSWSQYNLWLTSKREYWKRYNQGYENKSNKYFAKGKELAKMLEGAEVAQSNDPMQDVIVKKIPKLDYTEDELVFKVGDKDVLCYLDGVNIDYKMFAEVKTGKIPWTQERVDDHDQLLFYALAIWKLKKVLPSSMLIWVETEETENRKELNYTGRVEVFMREFKITELERFEQKVAHVIKEIEEYEYEEYELEDEKVAKYVDLDRKIKAMQLEQSAIKLEIEQELIDKGVNYGKSIHGNFTFSERKSWKYSDAVAELKKEISKQQKHEQKQGIASYSVNKSLTFKPL